MHKVIVPFETIGVRAFNERAERGVRRSASDGLADGLSLSRDREEADGIFEAVGTRR